MGDADGDDWTHLTRKSGSPNLQDPHSPISASEGLLHGNTAIHPGGHDEDDEFSATSIAYPPSSSSTSSLIDDDNTTIHENDDTVSLPSTLQDEDEDARDNSSISLHTSVWEHSYANGRRYHRYRHGRYPIPNDETEQNREDMLHTMMLEATDGRLFYAPLGRGEGRDANPQKIIDLGTGTGVWAIESMV